MGSLRGSLKGSFPGFFLYAFKGPSAEGWRLFYRRFYLRITRTLEWILCSKRSGYSKHSELGKGLTGFNKFRLYGTAEVEGGGGGFMYCVLQDPVGYGKL